MAMVFLTDRKMDNNIINYNNHLNNQKPIFEKIEKEKINQKIQAPFNIQGKGHQDFNKINKNPGPGSYNIEVDIIKPQQNSNSNLNFLSKSPRFNKNKELDESPGPGSYNIYDKPLIKKRLSQRPNSNISFKFNINSFNNISTIPAKKQVFGYFENDDGELIQAIDPLYEEYFSGEKNNSVGPDRYNIHTKEKNPIVNWNRMSARNLNYINKDNYTINNNINNINNISKNTINNESIGDTRNISKLETDISFIKNSNNKEKKKFENRIKMKDLIDNYKRKLNSSRVLINKKPEIEPIDIQSELEFLNYSENRKNSYKALFYPINFNQMRYQIKPEEYQFFGSSVERGINKLPITDRVLNPGPGSYFHNTKNYFKLKNKNKNKNKINPTFSKSKRLTSVLNKFYAVGPGSYNLNNDITKKSFSKCGSFSSEKRFPDLNIEKGIDLNKNINSIEQADYNIKDLWKKDLKKEYKKQSYVNVEKEIKMKMLKKIKEQKPDFNNYQNFKMINLIQTKVNSKINPYTSENIPFMSGIGRFTMNKEIRISKNRGPGSYEIIKNYDNSFNKKLNNAPFNSTQEKKISYLNRSNSCVSPADYQKNSYFEWNKKSFNVMFV